jgi:hypothetical protein
MQGDFLLIVEPEDTTSGILFSLPMTNFIFRFGKQMIKNLFLCMVGLIQEMSILL